MTLRQEINQDIIENCDRLLDVLRNESATNDAPDGRMIFQCRWLKEQAAADALSFPVEEGTHTLRYVYTEEQMRHLASSPDAFWPEIGIYMYGLLKLIKGQVLNKPPYYPYTGRCIDALIQVMRRARRALDQYEQGAIDELENIKQSLAARTIEPPLATYFPDYPNLRNVFSLTGSSIDDLPNGKKLIWTVTRLIFEGVRPESWVTPEAADEQTASLE